MSNTHTCAQCGAMFESDWSDEEAQAEADAVFGDTLIDPVVVCDDCYKAMTKAYPPAQWRRDVAALGGDPSL